VALGAPQNPVPDAGAMDAYRAIRNKRMHRFVIYELADSVIVKSHESERKGVTYTDFIASAPRLAACHATAPLAAAAERACARRPLR
jgi:hypothetical protein